jgi:hypothetical protein
MRLIQKIERLQKQVALAKHEAHRLCPHIQTLIMFGEIRKDPPPCPCGGERAIISVIYETPRKQTA